MTLFKVSRILLSSIIVNNSKKINLVQHKDWTSRYLSISNARDWDFIDLHPAAYEKICSETLEGLTDYFETIIESVDNLDSPDVQYSDGVLTVNLGLPYGTYVINRQTPNKQIWLSSPTSGPKRYDFLGTENGDVGKWIYKHSGESLHSLLQREIKEIIKNNVDFSQLPYAY